MALKVQPHKCLHDESVIIIASNLTAKQKVTIKAVVYDCKDIEYYAYAHFIADGNGQVDLSTSESLGGSYVGNFQMGLISSLVPSPLEYKYMRFFKREVEIPMVVSLCDYCTLLDFTILFKVKFHLYDGHLSSDELYSDNCPNPYDTMEHQRLYMAPGVLRIPVRHRRIRGTLFIPEGNGPFPAVIDLFGTAGGLLEFRSAQLASRGIASLALAYFAYEDLPSFQEKLDIAYFHEAVDYLLSHEKVLKPAVGVIGVSKGAEIALSLATFIPQVQAVVWINGSCCNVGSNMILEDGSEMEALQFDISKVEILEEAYSWFNGAPDPFSHPESIIPIERSTASFLFLVGMNDENWKSEAYADICVQRLKAAGKSDYEVMNLNGCGHLIEPPYSPFCYSSYHKMVRGPLIWGGINQPHCVGQIISWVAIISFFKRTLHGRRHGKI